jgi:hypothetical protein
MTLPIAVNIRPSAPADIGTALGRAAVSVEGGEAGQSTTTALPRNPP